MIRLASDLSIPLELTTQAVGIVAKRRAGKSYLSRRMAEQLLKAGQQVAIVDPKGDWWGIRSGADGKSPGLPVVILGGEHGDLPLEAGAGEVVAKLVVEERVSVLLDLSLFRKHEVATFMTGFLENLYRLKAREQFRTPLTVIIDEADAIAPQKPQKGEERMLGAADDIVRRGGQRGIGCMMITQRTAVLNKNVLTQCQVLIALRTIAPQDLKAMDAWIEVHGEETERATLMASLPSLPVGDAWVWSPGWPTTKGIFQRVHVLPIETFDSGATPKPGEKRVEPRNLADVDLAALQRQMAATIERKQADDPKLLRKRIAELEKHVAMLERGTPVVDEKAIARAVAAAVREHESRFDQMRTAFVRLVRYLESRANDLAKLAATDESTAESYAEAVARLEQETAGESRAAVPVGDTQKGTGANRTPSIGGGLPSRSTPRPVATQRAPADGVTRPQQRILDALASFEALGIRQVAKGNLAVFADQSPTSSGYANNLGTLRTAGLLDYPTPGEVALTDAGRKVATAETIESLDELHDAWERKLPRPQWTILDVLIGAYPDVVEREALALAVNQSATSSGYANNLGKLRSLGLIDYRPGKMVVATELLFPEGL